jgi:hypothetical protein
MKTYIPVALSIVVSALIVAASIVSSAPGTVTKTETVTQTSTTTATTVLAVVSAPGETTTGTFQCSITGQPDGFFLRVVYDSSQTPVAGAVVNATSLPAYCNNVPATTPHTSTFTTSSGTEWYLLAYENIAGYSISVTFSGHAYSISGDTSPLSVTCATLDVPSGVTSVTSQFLASDCPIP